MYKAKKIGKFRFTFERFNIERKKISPVYLTGYRFFESDDSKNYTLVLGRCRIMFAIDKDIACGQG